MTEKKKHFVSLSVKPLFVLLLGLVLGVCVCLLANFTGEQIIERSYMSDKAVLKRTNRAAQEFQSFVRQNSISTRDTDMLARWGESRKNYYIMLYHDQRQILEIGWWGADSAAVDAYSLKEQMASVVYPIVFRDGTFYAVIYDNSDSQSPTYVYKDNIFFSFYAALHILSISHSPRIVIDSNFVAQFLRQHICQWSFFEIELTETVSRFRIHASRYIYINI